MLSIDKGVNYRNFGYIPKGVFLKDVYGKVFGHRNLAKRLQARDIMDILALKSNEVVLDFGCGDGYFTVEMAKLAQKAVGIDIVEEVKTIKIPPSLKDKLEYIQSEGGNLPFEDNSFDTLLASEIIATVEDPVWFLNEFKRVLKPGGRLIVCNGTGHPYVEEAYESKNGFFKEMQGKYADSMPSSYAEYCKILNHSFGNAIDWFYTTEDLDKLLTSNGFTQDKTEYSPGKIAGTYFTKSQFVNYLKTGQTHTRQKFLIKYLLFSLIGLFEKKKYKGGLLYAAINKK